MVFFGKNKITFDQIAHSLADRAFRSISEASLQKYRILIKDSGESEEINAKQKREILVFEMLGINRAVLKVLTNHNESTELLDKFHSKIYDMISKSENGQADFEEFVNERYRNYYPILSSEDENSFLQLGKQFAFYFFDKDNVGSGLVLMVSSAEFFVLSIEVTISFLEGIFSKFEVIK